MEREDFIGKLPAEIEDRLGETTFGRQRVVASGEYLLLILHYPPQDGSYERDSVVFLRDGTGEYECNGKPDGEKELQKLLDKYEGIFDACEDRFRDEAEVSELFELLREMTPMTRAVKNMSATLQTARDHVEGDAFLISMRDESFELARSFELLSADIQITLERKNAEAALAQARQTEEMTSAQHKLNILAAITFPLMAIATLFGMNLQSGLEQVSPVLFWMVFASGIFIGFAVKSWVARKRL
jgi:Mg2+ and Co2+ transporter CorA